MTVDPTAFERARAWVTGGVDPDVLDRLLSPQTVGAVVLPNRFVLSAMGTRMATPDGGITDRQVAYYARRARGGTGTIIVEGSSVHPGGTTYLRKPRLYDDRSVAGLARVAEAIRAEGVVAGIQLMHAGRHAASSTREGPAASVSGGTSPVGGGDNRPLDEAGVREVIAAFAAAAARACAAGFQLIELHAAHGYLIHDFLSPLRNHRTDAWGADPRRFLSEVIAAVKDAIPSDAAAIVRLSSSEPEPGGITVDQAAETAVAAEAAGADAVIVSGGNNENIEWIVPPVFMPFALYLEAAGIVKRSVTIPTAVVGRISTPAHAAEVMRSGNADLVVMGRALLADPDFVHKLVAVPEQPPIRPCIACNECLAQHIRDEPILCTVNPAAGREARESEMVTPVVRPRRILVVGAGPAGLLFSAHAARRGHHVTLVDRQHRLGGKLWLAAAAPYKTDEMLALYAALALEAERNDVDVRLGRDDVAELAEEVSADLVVISSGAAPKADETLADDAAGVMQAEEYLTLGHHPGWSRVAVLGAGDTACDAAARLATGGVSVWMLARGHRMARGIEPVSGRVLRRYLADLGVKVVFGCEVVDVSAGTLRYRVEGVDEVLEVDQVLLARGVEATAEPLIAHLGLADDVETRVIGDAGDPGNFLTSLRSAWDLALEV